MSVELSNPSANQSQASTRVDGELRCALTGKPIKAEEAYWAPPLITARQLVSTIVTTALRTPGNLGHILFDEQPNVPYANDAREQLASRRTTEQIKLLLLLLLVAAVILVPIFLLALG